MCRRLSKEFGIDEINYDEIINWTPPKQHGLNNCNVIIPQYYHLHKHPSKIFKIDYYEIIKDDIRNFRTLNKYQLEYINDLSHECKIELIDIFNNCIKAINEMK